MNEINYKQQFIVILVNPRSGNGKAVKIGQWLNNKLTEKKIRHELYNENWPTQFEQFTELWIVGGDGTINYFINHYKKINIPLALFKGGTGNDFAWKLYGDISTKEQLELVLQTDPKPVDALCCNESLYLNSLGIGFDGEVLQSMKTIRWLGGHLGYLWAVIRKIFSFKEVCFSIQSENLTCKEKFLLVIVNNSSRTGGGFMVAPNASVQDGLLDIILCKPLSIVKRLWYLPVIEKGQHLDLPFIHFNQQATITIECDQAVFAQMDGELIQSQHFVIKVLPGCFQFKF